MEKKDRVIGSQAETSAELDPVLPAILGAQRPRDVHTQLPLRSLHRSSACVRVQGGCTFFSQLFPILSKRNFL
jgi:hypothetical protein